MTSASISCHQTAQGEHCQCCYVMILIFAASVCLLTGHLGEHPVGILMGHLGELLFPAHNAQVKSPIITDLLYDRNWQVTHKGWTPGAQSVGRVVFLVGRTSLATLLKHPENLKSRKCQSDCRALGIPSWKDDSSHRVKEEVGV